MSIDTILHAILTQGQTQAQEIESRAQLDVGRIIAQAEAEAARLLTEARQRALKPALGDEARILHRATLEALQIVGEAQMVLVRRVVERVTAHLEKLRTESHYPQVFQSLLHEASEALRGSLATGEIACLEADPRDRALVMDVFHEQGYEQPAVFALRTWGGMIASSADGRIVVNNTLEARLERVKPLLYGLVCAMLEQETLPNR